MISRLRCGPIKRENGPVTIYHYDVAGNVVSVETKSVHQIEERRTILERVDNLTRDEKLRLLQQLVGQA